MPNPIVSTNLLSFLRYGALASGLAYGFTHNLTLYRAHLKHLEHEKHHHEVLEKANELWSEHVAKETGDDPNFDLEKLLNYASKAK